MHLQLLIKGEVIETVELDLSRYHTYEDRHGKIQVVSEWLKYKYARTICLVQNWKIEMVAPSKANSITNNTQIMTKNVKVLSLAQALAAGYTMAVEDGDENMFGITGLTEKELSDYRELQPETCYWLIDNEPKHFEMNGDSLRELVGEVADNQDEFNDEDMELKQLVDDLYEEQPALFDALAAALNEKWKQQHFYMPSNAQIDFTL
jgi:hypothetical protein